MLLSTGLTSYEAYEVVIGASENTVSMIKKLIGGEVVAQQETPSILSCSQAKYGISSELKMNADYFKRIK